MVSSAAMKYARALADVALESNSIDQAKSDLEAFVEAYRVHGELGEVLRDPTIPLDPKLKIVRQVARKMGLSVVVINFLLVIVERSRVHLLEELAEAYQDVLDEYAGIVRVGVLSSHPLEPKIQRRLEEVLSKMTGKMVKFSYRVDADLIGGLRLQVGSTVFDGTIRTQLEELRRRLVFTAA